MSIEAIGAVGAQLAAPAASSPESAAKSGLFDAVLEGIANVNRDMQVTQKAVEGMALGQTDNLHQVMIGLEQTRLSFELLLQVRNRVLEAYQEIMRMQV